MPARHHVAMGLGHVALKGNGKISARRVVHIQAAQAAQRAIVIGALHRDFHGSTLALGSARVQTCARGANFAKLRRMVETDKPQETLEEKQRRWQREANNRLGHAPQSQPLGQDKASRPLSTPLPPPDLRK